MKELYLRWRWGYPINFGFRLKPKSREVYVLFRDKMGFEVNLSFHQDKIIEIHAEQKPDNYITHPGISLSEEVWNCGLEALKCFFEKSGDSPIVKY